MNREFEGPPTTGSEVVLVLRDTTEGSGRELVWTVRVPFSRHRTPRPRGCPGRGEGVKDSPSYTSSLQTQGRSVVFGRADGKGLRDGFGPERGSALPLPQR